MTNEEIIASVIMYFYKKHKGKGKGKKEKSSNRKKGNPNSRQKRKARCESITECQRLSIVNAVLNKRRLLVYTDNL